MKTIWENEAYLALFTAVVIFLAVMVERII